MNGAGYTEETMTNVRAERVREVARLGTRTGRTKAGEFLAEGPQAVREAMRLHLTHLEESKAPVVGALYATEDCLDRYPEFEEMADKAPGLLTRLVSPEVLAAMADTVTPQGIVAVCPLPETSLEDLAATRPKLVAVLCRIQDPGNAGTILRAADAAGADALVLTSGSVDIYNPKAVRSTVGSIFHLPIITNADLGETLALFKSLGATILAADGYGAADLDKLQDVSAARRAGSTAAPEAGQPVLEEPTIWLFGNEGEGLDETELAGADHRVAVPLYGIAESLNVATAATVCLYASARAQRRS
ncbi:TrmH family RNA methyltransferase [Paeniglutamicibacter gangotriensis]|uniref:TrmH family RNA methyltransferase n=1 Tax=Paeniglutamicibacter gangotriensis TaxID=254787 RepID=UPI0037C65780